MRSRHFVAVAAIALLGGLGDVAPAPACGCGGNHGVVVALGESPHQVPWRIRARHGDHVVEVDFSYLPPGADDGGYSTTLPYPLSRRFTFDAVAGSDGVQDEQDVSGVTSHRVARVVVTLADGSRAAVRPRIARRQARRHRPWLHGMRFFDLFFHGAASPQRAAAYDARGRVLARTRLS